MNSAQISFRTRRRWLWLFAALLPYALYALVSEQNSWRPKTLIIKKPYGNSEDYPVFGFAWSPDSRKISVPSSNKQHILVDVNSHKILGFTSKTFEEQNLSRLDSFESNERTKSYSPGISDELTKFYSPDGKAFAQLYREGRYPGWPGKQIGPSYGKAIMRIQLYDCKTKHLLHNLLAFSNDDFDEGYEGIIRAQFLKQGRLFYVQTVNAGKPKNHLWRVTDGKELQGIYTKALKNSYGYETIISDDASMTASYPMPSMGMPNGKEIDIWDLKTGNLIRHIRNPNEIVEVRFSPDGRTLAVRCKNGTLTLHRIK